MSGLKEIAEKKVYSYSEIEEVKQWFITIDKAYNYYQEDFDTIDINNYCIKSGIDKEEFLNITSLLSALYDNPTLSDYLNNLEYMETEQTILLGIERYNQANRLYKSLGELYTSSSIQEFIVELL